MKALILKSLGIKYVVRQLDSLGIPHSVVESEPQVTEPTLIVRGNAILRYTNFDEIIEKCPTPVRVLYLHQEGALVQGEGSFKEVLSTPKLSTAYILFPTVTTKRYSVKAAGLHKWFPPKYLTLTPSYPEITLFSDHITSKRVDSTIEFSLNRDLIAGIHFYLLPNPNPKELDLDNRSADIISNMCSKALLRGEYAAFINSVTQTYLIQLRAGASEAPSLNSMAHMYLGNFILYLYPKPNTNPELLPYD